MYQRKYNANVSESSVPAELIPVASRWLGSWRLSVDRRAHNIAELTHRYDKEALTWQQTLTRLGITRDYQSLASKLYERLDQYSLQPPMTVLECGAGTAALSVALAKIHATAINISAVDISAVMIKQAQITFEQAGLDVDLTVADIRKLPHADNSQDVVIAAHVLEHLADPGPALREMYRVLKPGGLIVLCCTRRSLSGRWIQMKWRTHTVTRPLLQEWLQDLGFGDIDPLHIKTNSQLYRLSLAVTATKPASAAIAA